MARPPRCLPPNARLLCIVVTSRCSVLPRSHGLRCGLQRDRVHHRASNAAYAPCATGTTTCTSTCSQTVPRHHATAPAPQYVVTLPAQPPPRTQRSRLPTAGAMSCWRCCVPRRSAPAPMTRAPCRSRRSRASRPLSRAHPRFSPVDRAALLPHCRNVLHRRAVLVDCVRMSTEHERRRVSSCAHVVQRIGCHTRRRGWRCCAQPLTPGSLAWGTSEGERHRDRLRNVVTAATSVQRRGHARIATMRAPRTHP